MCCVLIMEIFARYLLAKTPPERSYSLPLSSMSMMMPCWLTVWSHDGRAKSAQLCVLPGVLAGYLRRAIHSLPMEVFALSTACQPIITWGFADRDWGGYTSNGSLITAEDEPGRALLHFALNIYQIFKITMRYPAIYLFFHWEHPISPHYNFTKRRTSWLS